jgi:hypothetical protein
MLQQRALAFGAAAKKERRRAGLDSYAYGLDVILYVLHGVIDSEGVINAAAGAVDIQLYIFVRVFIGQEQKLGDYQIGSVLVHVSAEKYNIIF